MSGNAIGRVDITDTRACARTEAEVPLGSQRHVVSHIQEHRLDIGVTTCRDAVIDPAEFTFDAEMVVEFVAPSTRDQAAVVRRDLGFL